MLEQLRSLLVDPASDLFLRDDVLVNLITEGAGIALTVLLVAPLTARIVRWQDNGSWKDARTRFARLTMERLKDLVDTYWDFLQWCDVDGPVGAVQIESWRDDLESWEAVLENVSVKRRRVTEIGELEARALSPKMLARFETLAALLRDFDNQLGAVRTLTRRELGPESRIWRYEVVPFRGLDGDGMREATVAFLSVCPRRARPVVSGSSGFRATPEEQRGILSKAIDAIEESPYVMDNPASLREELGLPSPRS